MRVNIFLQPFVCHFRSFPFHSFPFFSFSFSSFSFLACLLPFFSLLWEFLVYILFVKFLWEYYVLRGTNNGRIKWQVVFFISILSFLEAKALSIMSRLLDSPLTCVKDWAVTCRERLTWHLIYHPKRKGTVDLKW